MKQTIQLVIILTILSACTSPKTGIQVKGETYSFTQAGYRAGEPGRDGVLVLASKKYDMTKQMENQDIKSFQLFVVDVPKFEGTEWEPGVDSFGEFTKGAFFINGENKCDFRTRGNIELRFEDDMVFFKVEVQLYDSISVIGEYVTVEFSGPYIELPYEGSFSGW